MSVILLCALSIPTILLVLWIANPQYLKKSLMRQTRLEFIATFGAMALISGAFALWQLLVFHTQDNGRSIISVDSMVLSFTIAFLGIGMAIARTRMARDSRQGKAG